MFLLFHTTKTHALRWYFNWDYMIYSSCYDERVWKVEEGYLHRETVIFTIYAELFFDVEVGLKWLEACPKYFFSQLKFSLKLSLFIAHSQILHFEDDSIYPHKFSAHLKKGANSLLRLSPFFLYFLKLYNSNYSIQFHVCFYYICSYFSCFVLDLYLL